MKDFEENGVENNEDSNQNWNAAFSETGSPTPNMGPHLPYGNETTRKSSNAGIWLLTFLILGVFVFLIIWAGNSGDATVYGSVKGEESYRYGNSNELKLSVDNEYAAHGREVVWYVDGQEVQREKYGSQNAIHFNMSDYGVGPHEVMVKVGENEIGKINISVEKPLLSVTAPTHEIYYGDELPKFNAQAAGWVDDDTPQSLGFDGSIDFNRTGSLAVGEYPLEWNGFENEKYEVSSSSGNLKIMPRKITFAPCQFAKVYDGSAKADSSQLKLIGAVGNDKVEVNAVVEFEDKNAANNKRLIITQCELVGEDKDNYYIDYENVEFVGSIAPLNVRVNKIVANDKVYDGTTTVTFSSSGDISGVLNNDQVNIGEICARFEDAWRGYKKRVIIDKITLVGNDSANYNVICEPVKASIVGRHTLAVPSN